MGVLKLLPSTNLPPGDDGTIDLRIAAFGRKPTLLHRYGSDEHESGDRFIGRL
ncbi:MAG: hypothetical protein M8364_20870 [Methylobacter sp.]|nr:hypothetical protein [Methylobacter sp.]